MGLGIGIGLSPVFGVRGGWAAYWSDKLAMWWKNRSDTEINESVASTLNAEILLPCADFNGTDNYLLSDIYLPGGTPISLEFEFILADYGGNNTIIGAGGYNAVIKGLTVLCDSGERMKVITSNGTSLATIELWGLSIVDIGKKIRIKISWDGITGGTLTGEIWGDDITIDGVGVVDYNTTSSTNTCGWADNSREVLTIGCYRPSNPLSLFSSQIIRVFVDGLFDIYPNGLGSYEYDILGNTVFTWQGAAERTAYSLLGSDYHLTNGYYRYINGSNVEYVPFGADTTVIVAAGFSLAAYGTYYGSIVNINMFPCIIDMNPDSSEDANLAILDRSSETYQTAVSRVADDYDVSNPFRYHVDNIADPRIYSTFFEVGYAARFFSKITNQNVSGTYYIKSLDEMLLTLTDQDEEGQIKAGTYCNTLVYAV